MLDPRTLRGRLTLAYTVALIVALLLFAAASLVIVDRAQRNLLDASLSATSNSIIVGLEITHGRLELEHSDREQFAAIVGARSAAIFDLNGHVAISSSAQIPPAIQQRSLDPVAPSFAETVVATERVRYYIVPIVRDEQPVGSVAVWRDVEAVTQLDRRLALLFAFAIPLFAAGAILAGATIARRGLRPLDRIASIASAIEAHDLRQRLNLPAGKDELTTFAAAFDRMLDRLADAFARERRFTSDASHELRAPLSVIRAESDLALRRERTPEEYRLALAGVAREADALEAMTRDLLALARAEETVASIQSAVDLNAIAVQVIDRIDVLAGDRSITITSSLHAGTIEANPAELERIVFSLVQNAIKYARTNGRVEVQTRADGDRSVLTVTDDGPGFSDEARTHAFERFWRDDPARSRDGTGLGLSIVRALVERAGGSIVLSNEPGGGGLVTVWFRSTASTDADSC
jgi:two-component system OmpR family sensor kinase